MKCKKVLFINSLLKLIKNIINNIQTNKLEIVDYYLILFIMFLSNLSILDLYICLYAIFIMIKIY